MGAGKMNNTKTLAANKWASILSNFIDAKSLSGKHGPCPLCGGKDRFRFDDKDGTGSYFCSGCGAGSGIHLLALHQGVSHQEAWRIVEKFIGVATETKPKPEIDRIERIKKIIDLCRPIARHDEVFRYLFSRRINNIPASLSKAMASGGASMMVARFANGSRLAGLHVTFIRDGKKDGSSGSSKKMYGLKDGGLIGSAIRLHKVDERSHIIVAEGIETALSASQLFGYPAWATGSAALMEALEVPKEIKNITIAGDNDASFTGQSAAYILAKRLTQEGHCVTVTIPEREGDWNDQA